MHEGATRSKGDGVPQGPALHERDELASRVGPVATIGKRWNRPDIDGNERRLDPGERVVGARVSKRLVRKREESRGPGLASIPGAS